jgi:hypothetical protein
MPDNPIRENDPGRPFFSMVLPDGEDFMDYDDFVSLVVQAGAGRVSRVGSRGR